MASGYGIRGGVGRCYEIFNDYSDCIRNKDNAFQCVAFAEDYKECLHHKKEVLRQRPFHSHLHAGRSTASDHEGEAEGRSR